jgi:hypothetical protein
MCVFYVEDMQLATLTIVIQGSTPLHLLPTLRNLGERIDRHPAAFRLLGWRQLMAASAEAMHDMPAAIKLWADEVNRHDLSNYWDRVRASITARHCVKLAGLCEAQGLSSEPWLSAAKGWLAACLGSALAEAALPHILESQAHPRRRAK